MAGIITISKGHDASYPWRQIGTAAGGARSAEAGTGYYLSPAEKGGEPPGTWTGRGVAELGLEPGGVVDRAVFEPLYGRHLDPRDPSGETRLGRAPGKFRTAEAIYESLLAAEPGATSERRAEQLIEASAMARTPDLYWDATFSVSKSISLFHASALANAAAAAGRGDQAAAGQWEQVAGEIWDAVMEGNAAALDYLQHEAGQTRAGYHPGGRWEDAREWVIASFRQHTSRDGDPQLHVHNLILHKVRREGDGQWRALDSMSLYRHRPAASAIAALAAENALSRRFGVRWVPRKDGHGREIDGVSQALMDMFSSRRQSIGPLTARLAQAYEARFGRAPDARALASLRQWANHATRRGKDAAPLDLGALARQWAAQAAASEAGALEPLAPAVMTTPEPAAPAPAAPAQSGASAGSDPVPAEPLTGAQARRLIQEAVAAVQTAQPAWTEADLIRHLGERLPAATGPMPAGEAAALLPALARQALATEAVPLAAPEWPRVPDSLRRASGESMYIPHGATRYATAAQLTLEDRLLARAQEQGAPRLDPATAARQLGGEQAHLEAQLRAGAAGPGAETGPGAYPGRTGSGLRADQAAAAFHALTSERRAVVIAGPAGSGKTRTVAEIARIWHETGTGEVIGLATSQNAANILGEAGVPRTFNTARFLGHLDGRRQARPPQPVAAGSLLILDEASMMSIADIAAILSIAAARNCKVVITGDHQQLAAVEGGGAMAMLARRLGHALLTEPQRFTAAWERDATLRLRDGDVTVLADYRDHGRLRGGTEEEATEQAYRGWLADYLDGTDTILIARTEDQARELSRRARDDLIRYGHVTPAQPVRLATGEHASAGDLIMARRNARPSQPNLPDRELANRDILQITRTTTGLAGNRAEVRRLTGRDPATGQPAWSAPFTVPHSYLASHATLAYATTAHAAQGRTTATAHVLVDGAVGRQALYVAMSRGQHANYAYCVTDYSRSADTRAGSRLAPELERARRLTREHNGLPNPELPGTAPLPASDPVTVLAAILTRDTAQLTATDTLERELSRADHLAVLGGIWDDLTSRAQHTRYQQALTDALPEGLAEPVLADPACTWLWRTLREAETAGLDAEQAFRQAIAERSLAGARDIARVIDSRLRRILDKTQPQPCGPWSACVPETGDTDMNRYLRQLAEAMDDRTRRLGEHTTQTQPAWALQTLGPVPADPAERDGWELRASQIAAYRERYGHDHPSDPIGPERSKNTPEARAAWHTALAALGSADGIDLRGCTDGELWLRRTAYERETAWAPPNVAEELRLMRISQRDAHVNAVRAEHEAAATADLLAAARHQELAAIWRALEAKAAREAAMFTTAQDTRSRWEQLTQTTRAIAIAADAELRRRHPRMELDPLHPHAAEDQRLASATIEQQGNSVQLVLDGIPPSASALPGLDERPGTGPARDSESQTRLVLGLTPAAAKVGITDQVHRIHKNALLTQAGLDELASVSLPDQHDGKSPGQARPAPPGARHAAVLQPPQPEIIPAAQVISAYHGSSQADAGAEAHPS